MKITGQIEQIFAQAVALDQNGGLKNSIYVDGREVYILNYDHTVLLRFRLRDSESPFSFPVSFKANDYDSNEFFEEDGKIVFVTKAQGFEKKKICGTAEYTVDEIKKLFSNYIGEKEGETVTISNSVLALLDDDLSHIEFSGEKGNPLKMIQRNIYSGGIIEISEKSDGLFQNNLQRSYGPVGIKTKDFSSLFTFQKNLKFVFPTGKNENYVIVKSIDKNKRDMTGIVSLCLYDELIEIRNSKQ